MTDRRSATAVLLGLAQDGGVPHAGCDCQRCSAALADPSSRVPVVALGLISADQSQYWIVDATPDLPIQWAALRRLAPAGRLAGIAVTHVHSGHIAGLMHLGREAAAVQDVPILASSAVLAYLASNEPWASLLHHGSLLPRPIWPGVPTELAPGMSLTPVAVPHRAEFADTVAYVVEGTTRALMYCPDADTWDAWPVHGDLEGAIDAHGVEHALLDGTFYSAVELPAGRMSQVPHPMAMETAARLRRHGVAWRVVHLNHTNPLLGQGPERQALEAAGGGVADVGQTWSL